MTAPALAPALPEKLSLAMWRGIVGRCPRCNSAKLFARFLKPVAVCPACDQNWALHQADDFPPYVSIFLTGHILAPIIIAVSASENLPLWAKMTSVTAIACAMMLSLLQPAKGAIIAMQWWMGMHGFSPAGRDEALHR